jgi:hypothetical protein
VLTAEIELQAARRQLERVVASAGSSHNERLVRFLRFVVEQHLEGKDDELKESVVAVEVFGRSADHNPCRLDGWSIDGCSTSKMPYPVDSIGRGGAIRTPAPPAPKTDSSVPKNPVYFQCFCFNKMRAHWNLEFRSRSSRVFRPASISRSYLPGFELYRSQYSAGCITNIARKRRQLSHRRIFYGPQLMFRSYALVVMRNLD